MGPGLSAPGIQMPEWHPLLGASPTISAAPDFMAGTAPAPARRPLWGHYPRFPIKNLTRVLGGRPSSPLDQPARKGGHVYHSFSPESQKTCFWTKNTQHARVGVWQFLVPGIPVSAVQPQDSFGGFGVFQDLQSTVGTVPVVGAYAQRGLAPVATAEYLAEQGTRLGRDALNVYNDGRAVGNTAKKMMGLGFTLPGAGYKLAGEGHRKKKKHHWLK